MLDDDRIREVVSRYISLKNELGEDGRSRQTLHLTNGDDDSILMAGPTASLRARRSQLELALVTMVHDVLTCGRCGTTDCAGWDEGICTVIQVME